MTGSDNRVVLVDMDGVLADFDRAVLEQLPDHIARVDRTNFYIARDYPDHKPAVEEIYNHPRFFYDLEPVDGAIDGWRRLLEWGYEPRICSAPLSGNPESVAGKHAWLEEHLVPEFGIGVLDNAVIDKRKFDYHGLVLIDDRPDVQTNNGQASWQHVVFDRPYNQHSASVLRLYGWSDSGFQGMLRTACVADRPASLS